MTINNSSDSLIRPFLFGSNLNISEVAMAVGFDDRNYFSRLFKKISKTSPSGMQK